MDLGERTRNLDGYAKKKKPFKRKYNEMSKMESIQKWGSEVIWSGDNI